MNAYVLMCKMRHRVACCVLFIACWLLFVVICVCVCVVCCVWCVCVGCVLCVVCCVLGVGHVQRIIYININKCIHPSN